MTKTLSLRPNDASFRPSAARIAFSNLLCQILMNLAGMATGVLLARILGVAARGDFSAINMPSGLAGMLLTLGNGYALIHYIPKGLKRENIVANNVWYSLIAGLIGTAIVWVVVPIWMTYYSPSVKHWTQVCALTIPVGLIANLGLSTAIGREDYKTANFLRAMPRVLSALAFLACWLFWGFTLVSAIVINIGISILLSCVTILYLSRGGRNAWKPDWKEIKLLQSYGIKVVPSTIVALTNLRLDQLFMVGLLAPEALGLYTVSVTVSEFLGIAGSAFTNLLEGRGANAEPGQAKEFFQRSMRITLLVTVTLAILLCFSAKLLIVLVYGPKFANASVLVQVLCFGTIAQMFNRNTAGFLNGAGHPWADSIAQGFSMVATVILVPILLHSQGVIGAAIASNVAYFGSAIILLAYVRIYLKYDVYSTLVPKLADITLITSRLQGVAYTSRRNK